MAGIRIGTACGLVLGSATAVAVADHAGPTLGLSSAAPSAIARYVASMTPAQKAGELLMIPAATSGSDLPLAAIRKYHFGSVLLIGNSGATPAAEHAVTAQLQSAGSGSLLISTDQEGGYVQRLRPPGFAAIPTALSQGAMSSATLRSKALGWGRQLKAAGVDLDLAPVLDVVPNPSTNPPIGEFQREYGSTPARVVAGSAAFAAGLRSAGVAVTGKHFPGLGLVHGNTDTTKGVTDTTIGAKSPYLTPFRQAVRSGFGFMMMSTADYQLLDPGVPAAFSHKIVTGLLRDALGFHGVVMSDSLDAVQVSGYAKATRAFDFIRAGGDLIVTTSLATAITMQQALAREQSSATFRSLVNASVTRILTAKADLGLRPYLVGAHVVAGWSSSLGQPIGPEYAARGYGVSGYFQRFSSGNVLVNSSYGTYLMRGAIAGSWSAASYGWPMSSARAVSAHGWSGFEEDFAEGGGARARAFGRAGSVQVLKPGVLTKFEARGGLAGMGWPVSLRSQVGYGVEGWVQRFQLGTALIRSRFGVFASGGKVLASWRAASRGWPTDDLSRTTLRGRTGWLQTFRKGSAGVDYAFLPSSSTTVSWRNGRP